MKKKLKNILLLILHLNIRCVDAGGRPSHEVVTQLSEEELIRDTYFSLLPKDVLDKTFLLMEIEKARSTQLVPFDKNELQGKITADQKNIIYQKNGWNDEEYMHTIPCALSNNRKFALDNSSKACSDLTNRKDFLILRKIHWNEAITNEDELWKKEIDLNFLYIGAVSNDGLSVFLMQNDRSHIIWWKLQIAEPLFFMCWQRTNRKLICELKVEVPDKNKKEIDGIAYLDRAKKLCLFYKSGNISLIDL